MSKPTPQPDIERDDTVQVLGDWKKMPGRIGKVYSIYWTSAPPTPRWLVIVKFKRVGGNFPIQPVSFPATALVRLSD